MHTDRCGNIRRQKCCAKGSGKEVKIREFMYRDTTNVEPEIYVYTSNSWSHWNSNEKLKVKFGSCTRKTFDRFTTKDSYTWNITHNSESTAVRPAREPTNQLINFLVAPIKISNTIWLVQLHNIKQINTHFLN